MDSYTRVRGATWSKASAALPQAMLSRYPSDSGLIMVDVSLVGIDRQRTDHCMFPDTGSRGDERPLTLSSGSVCLRRWRDEDRETFAAMNSDARVMEFFRSPLSRAESDAMVDRIEKHFSEHDFGLWAIEVPSVAAFIGFAGFDVARFNAPFTPCVEVGWRLAFEYWGHGYATEAARLALGYGFGTLAFSEVVSFTSVTNRRSRAVMERLGMRRVPAEDFDYPALPEGHPLRRHVLYRLGSDSFFAMG